MLDYRFDFQWLNRYQSKPSCSYIYRDNKSKTDR